MMGDDLRSLEAELFRAAREERPRFRARRASLRAARKALDETRRIRGRRMVGLALAALVLSITIVVASRRPEAGAEITADRSVVAHSARPAPAEAKRSERMRPASSAVRTAPIAPPPRASTPARVPSPRAPTLEEEVRALQGARSALASGDATSALRQLDDYERRLRGTRLRSEAAVLRIEAMARGGREDEAAAIADRFVTENPNDPLVDRARGLARPTGSPMGSGARREESGARREESGAPP